uniref:Uncharacterized protein n=1 Tax=Anguilla anguilla TaxID=7936 RepID=A0A0E9RX52_ANGAN
MTVMKIGKQSSSTKPAIFLVLWHPCQRVDLPCLLPVVRQRGCGDLWKRCPDDQSPGPNGCHCSACLQH